MTLHQYISDVADAISRSREAPPGFMYRSLEEFLLQHGQAFRVSANQRLRPAFRCVPQGCFDNAFRLAKRQGYRYTEGYACGPASIPVHHAWCLNAQNEVIDPTWSDHLAIGDEYVGVVIPFDLVKSTRHQANQSVLMNWQRGYPIFKQPWKDHL